MPTEQPAVKTLVTIAEMFAAMKETLIAADFGPISDKAVRINVAHSAFETGFWHGMWNFNPGNAKSLVGDVYDWTFYPCGEELQLASAERYRENDPEHVAIVSTYKLGTIEMASANFTPPNPMCRFRSFPTLDRGVEVYIEEFGHEFKGALPSLLAGDAPGFVAALKAAGYFTLDEATYLSRFEAVLAMVDKALSAAAVVVPPDLPTAPLPTCSSWMLAADAAATAIAVSISEHDTPTPWVPHGVYEETIGGVPWRFSMGSGPVRAVSTWKCVSSTPAHGDVAPPSDSGPFPSGGA